MKNRGVGKQTKSAESNKHVPEVLVVFEAEAPDLERLARLCSDWLVPILVDEFLGETTMKLARNSPASKKTDYQTPM